MYWNMDMELRKTRMIETKEGGKSVHHCEYSAEAPVALPRENKRDDGALDQSAYSQVFALRFNSPPPLNLRALWRAILSLGVLALAYACSAAFKALT